MYVTMLEWGVPASDGCMEQVGAGWDCDGLWGCEIWMWDKNLTSCWD